MGCEPKILKEVPLFALLDEDELAVLAAQVELRTFTPRQRIYKIGDPAGTAYVMVSGAVQVTTIEKISRTSFSMSQPVEISSASRRCWTRRPTRPTRSRSKKASASPWIGMTFSR
jgi:hypothetical protein